MRKMRKEETSKLDRSFLPSKKVEPVLKHKELTLGLGMKNGGGGLIISLKSGASVTLSLDETKILVGFVKLLTESYGWNN